MTSSKKGHRVSASVASHTVSQKEWKNLLFHSSWRTTCKRSRRTGSCSLFFVRCSQLRSTPMEDHVRIFDTTLRDGEQAPGCTMTKDEKLEVARQLARLKVDIIE